MTFRWTSSLMDQLERAARDQRRVAITRRGTEYIVFARRIEMAATGERLIGILPMTGDEIAFDLGQVEAFQVIP